LLRIALDVGFPEADDLPAKPSQHTSALSVTPRVCVDFGDPVGRIRSLREGSLERWPPPSVPEVAVAEHGDLHLSQHDVGAAG
jgi:hypothetical protein